MRSLLERWRSSNEARPRQPECRHYRGLRQAALMRSVATQVLITALSAAERPCVPLRTAASSQVEALSEGELKLLWLVTAGRTNREIAAELVVAVGTVKKHLNNIFGKLHTRSRTECVARARELDLV